MARLPLLPTLLLATLLPLTLAAPQPSTYASAVSGCNKPLPADQVPGGTDGQSYHITDFRTTAGTTRSYRIHIPSNYDSAKATPLIFSFHGHGKDSANQEALSEFSNEAEGYNPDAFAVYPDGLPLASGAQGWQGDARHNSTDDIGFVKDMIAYFESVYCIDSKRIYAAGKSNGGGFTGQVLACDPVMSKTIAAFAPVAGAYYLAAAESACTPTLRQTIPIPCPFSAARPPPILEFHGDADATIPYGGNFQNGACLPTVPHWVREWSKRQGMGLANVTTPGTGFLKYEYGNETIRGQITHYRVKGMAHDWPATKTNSDNGGEVAPLDATPIIMKFFNKYSL